MSYKKKTVKQLKEEIKSNTEELNRRIDEYRKSGKTLKDVEQNIELIKRISGVKKGRQAIKDDKKVIGYREVEIGTGDLNKATKSHLIRQARELQSFLQWDISTPTGQRQWEAREQAEWQTFNKHFSEYGFNKNEWRDLVEIFGAVGEAVLNQFGSGSGNQASGVLVREYKNANDIARANIVKEMHEVLKNSEGQGKSAEDLVDDLHERLSKY